jgi:hypothetical protein
MISISNTTVPLNAMPGAIIGALRSFAAAEPVSGATFQVSAQDSTASMFGVDAHGNLIFAVGPPAPGFYGVRVFATVAGAISDEGDFVIDVHL